VLVRVQTVETKKRLVSSIIESRVLRKLAEELAKPLSIICQQS